MEPDVLLKFSVPESPATWAITGPPVPVDGSEETTHAGRGLKGPLVDAMSFPVFVSLVTIRGTKEPEREFRSTGRG